MSETSDRIREYIQTQSASDARAVVLRQIRLFARKTLREYADEHYIIDFQDTVLVQDRHRDKRTDIISDAQSRATAANAAANMTELLVVFDAIASFIE